MNKLVNVYPSGPIMSLNIPIRTRVMNFPMDTGDIRKCLMAQAIVEEILADNSVIRLDFFNYDKDNSIKEKEVIPAKHVKEEPKQEPKVVEDIKTDSIEEPTIIATEEPEVEKVPENTEKAPVNTYSNRKNKNKK